MLTWRCGRIVELFNGVSHGDWWFEHDDGGIGFFPYGSLPTGRLWICDDEHKQCPTGYWLLHLIFAGHNGWQALGLN